MRIAYLIPVLLAAVVAAQDSKTPEDLVAELGHADYEVREQATRQLVELGEKAVPALEEALKSDDLEVRLRAGRALRAIRGGAATKPDQGPQREREAAPDDGRTPDLPAAPGSSRVSIQMLPGKVQVTLEREVGGERKVETYEAATLNELLEKHPELKRYVGGAGNGFRLRFGQGPDPFDMDRFWNDWNEDFDEHFKRLREEQRRELERAQRWLELFKEQQEQRREQLRERMQPRGAALGVRGRRPDPVLDAQLQLRGRGLVVEAVEKGSPAEALGFERYDVILKLDGRDVRGFEDVAAALEAHEKGAPLRATVIRAGTPRELTTAR